MSKNENSEAWKEYHRMWQQSRWDHSKDEVYWLKEIVSRGVIKKVTEARSSNGLYQLTTNLGIVDYWTTTGKWFIRSQRQYGHGHIELLKLIGTDGDVS